MVPAGLMAGNPDPLKHTRGAWRTCPQVHEYQTGSLWGARSHSILIRRSWPRRWASRQSAFPHPAADSGPTHFYIEALLSINNEQESGTKERLFRAPGRLSQEPTKGRKCRAVAPVCPQAQLTWLGCGAFVQKMSGSSPELPAICQAVA